MKPLENSASFEKETRRLDEWLLMLSAISHCIWYSEDDAHLLNEFCKILVTQAGYTSVTIELTDDLLAPEGVSEKSHFFFDQVLPNNADSATRIPNELILDLASDDAVLGRVSVAAEFDLSHASDAAIFLRRVCAELGRALSARTRPCEHAALQEQFDILALAVKQSPFAIVITNTRGELEYCNARFTEISGFDTNNAKNRQVLWSPNDVDSAARLQHLLSLQVGQHWQGEVTTQTRDAQDMLEHQIISPLHNDQGELTHFVAIKRNLSQSHQQLKEFEQALLLKEQALISSSNGIMITRSEDHDHSIVYVNPAFERITGYSANEVIGREGRFLVRDDLAQPDLEEIRSALREKREGRALLRNYRKDGTQFWNDLHISPVKDARGDNTTHFVSVINDVSERINYQKELEHQATHDNLTGLANRNLLNDRIDQAIAWAKRQNFSVGLLLLDLDHFKLINDGSGHGAGDAVLRQVAQRLTRCVRETDTVARLGGDEFVVILTDLPETEDVDVIAAKILSTLSRSFEVGGREVFVTASIGISLFPRDGDNGETLLRYADIAMYRVKEHGRNSVRQFIPEMGVTAISRLNMESALRRGLERGEFMLHYQPKMDVTNDKIIGAEALVRWMHPQIGLIHPIEFIPLAEETGLILPLGEWVFAEACRQQIAWQKEGLPALKIAVNVSSRQFRQEDLAERITTMLSNTGADPAFFIIELTESMVMQDVSSTLVALRTLKNLGLSISLDDFGTGYSSLSYLRKFPIDELKIDKSFINDIHSNPDDAAIASAIIAMALSLGLRVVAEGVESKEQVDMLLQMGCTDVQGYFYGRPVDAKTFKTRFVAHQEKLKQAH